MIIHFIGLGGAGKTTIAKQLARHLGIKWFDLDEYFIANAGDIGLFIQQYGYQAYAKRNVELYIRLHREIQPNNLSILVCSSGFMTYPKTITPQYLKIIQAIEESGSTFLLMPSYDLEECVKILVQRQLSRSYLNTTVSNEELKIRKRFDIYNDLQSHKVLTGPSIDEAIQTVCLFIAQNLSIKEQ